MDLNVIDANWLKTDAIDSFTSLIWTERYNESGEVTLVLPATDANRVLVTEGIFLHTPDSPEVMMIDTIDIEDGMLTATGKSLIDFMKNRLFRSGATGPTDAWPLTSHPSAGETMNAIMSVMVNPGTYITNGTVLTSAQGTPEVMPKITLGPYVTGAAFAASVPFGDMYTALKTIADLDSLGFYLRPQSFTDGTGNMLFQTYRGLDRTTSQSTNGVVIFDPSTDSLTGTKEFRSISGYKNVAWVFPNGITAQSQVAVAYAPGASALTNFQRRTMLVQATDVNVADYTTANLSAVLIQRGVDALANNNYARMMDGQIVPQNAYTYGTDYNLGDIVELRGPTGTVAQKARIAEYIRSQDSTGENAYPTLSVI